MTALSSDASGFSGQRSRVGEGRTIHSVGGGFRVGGVNSASRRASARLSSIFLTIALVLGGAIPGHALADEVINVYGPGGPAPAIQEA